MSRAAPASLGSILPERIIEERPALPSPPAPLTRRRTRLGSVELVLIATLIIAFMTHMTGLATVATPLATPTAMVVEYSVVAIYGVLAIMRGHLGLVLAGFTWIVYLIVQCFVWHLVSGFPVNTNAALSYGTMLFFIVFYETRLSVDTVLRLALGSAIVYVAIYAVFWEQILTAAGRDSNIYLPSDGIRPPRLYLAAPFASFTFVYGLISIRYRPLWGLPLLLLSGYVLLIAQTRFATVLLGIAVLAAVFGSVAAELRRTANIGLAIVFLALSGVSLTGFFVPGWNPYTVVASDASGAARSIQYEDGLNITRNHLLTGFGIPDSTENMQFFIRPRRPFYASDLGIAGLAMQYGVPMAMALVALCVAFITIPPLAGSQMSPLLWALFYATQQSAFGAVFANTLIGGSASMFAGIIIALWLRHQPSKRAAKNMAHHYYDE